MKTVVVAALLTLSTPASALQECQALFTRTCAAQTGCHYFPSKETLTFGRKSDKEPFVINFAGSPIATGGFMKDRQDLSNNRWFIVRWTWRNAQANVFTYHEDKFSELPSFFEQIAQSGEETIGTCAKH